MKTSHWIVAWVIPQPYGDPVSYWEWCEDEEQVKKWYKEALAQTLEDHIFIYPAGPSLSMEDMRKKFS
jgi:hypothetical protein